MSAEEHQLLHAPVHVVAMGVSATGKTSVVACIAEAPHGEFLTVVTR